MKKPARLVGLFTAMVMVLSLASPFVQPATTLAAGSGTLTAPAGNGTTRVTWTSATYTTQNYSGTTDLSNCTDGVNCDVYMLTVDIPANYWDTHEGGGVVEIHWASLNDDFDLYVFDSQGNEVGHSTSGHMET